MKKAGYFFGICLVFSLVSGAMAGGPTQAQLDSLEALQPPLVSTQSVIRYDVLGDSGIIGKSLLGSDEYWIAVRFTPDISSFTLQAVFFQVDNSLINTTRGCKLYVMTDAGGEPDSVLDSLAVSAPLPNRLRSAALLNPLPIGRGVNFWILLGPVPGGPDPDTVPAGWWGFHDNAAPSGRSMVSFDNRQSWDSLTSFTGGLGNWIIRAGGEYSPAPKVVINEVMFNADTASSDPSRKHEWVELYNPGEVQTTDDWQLVRGDSTSLNLLPKVTMPQNSYLVIHFAGGTPDTDLSDGRGDLYFPSLPSFFNDRKDACALLVPFGEGHIYQSITSWFLGNLVLQIDNDSFPVTKVEGQVNAGFIPVVTNKEFRRKPTGALGPLFTASAGISIGRDSASTDSHNPSARDVAFLGGKNAAGPTMGKKNFLPMAFNTTSPQISPVADKKWTIMLYLAADNGEDVYTQERWCYDILNQIEREIPTDKVQVAVLFDTRAAGSDMAYRGQLLVDLTDTVKNLEQIPISSMGDSAVLGDFINWTRTNLPAQNYVLALKGDGAGWEGLCGDRSTDRLEMGELKSALRQGGLKTDPLKLLILDAPLMSQLEVATQVDSFAHFMVASPEMIGPADFDYAGLVKKLSNLSTISPKALAEFAVDTLLERRRVSEDKYWFWVAIQLDSLKTLITQTNLLATQLEDGLEDVCKADTAVDNFQIYVRDRLVKETSHYGTQAQGMADFVDFRHLCFRLRSINPSTLCLPNTHKDIARVIDSLLFGRATGSYIKNPLVVARSSKNDGRHGTSIAAGLSIYFPSSRQHGVPISTARKIANNGVFGGNPGVDHPFDSTGLQKEAGVTDPPRIYAPDNTNCYPHSGICDTASSNDPARNHPFPPTANFDFVNRTRWDEFLIRYYKPVIGIGTHFFSKQLGEPIVLDARGTSDADDTLLLYMWDLSTTRDTIFSCDSFLVEDLDKNCYDDSTDEANFTAKRAIDTLPVGLLPPPGDDTLWLHVWDEYDRFSSLPLANRGYQTAKESLIVQIEYKKVQFAYEDLAVLTPFTNARLSIIPVPSSDDRDLTNPAQRTGMPSNYFTSQPDRPHIIWATGGVFSQTFPPNTQVALNNALDADSMSVWVYAPLGGKDTAANTYFNSKYKFNIPDTNRVLATYLVPDTFRLHFLRGLDTLELKTIPSTRLEKLTLTDQNDFALLRTNTNDIVAAARVVQEGQHAIIFSTFGFENLANSTDARNLLTEVLRWFVSPKSPPVPPGSLIGDMNGDGFYTSADVVLLTNCAFLNSGCPTPISIADVDCSGGAPTSTDVVLLSNRAILGITNPPWCGQ